MLNDFTDAHWQSSSSCGRRWICRIRMKVKLNVRSQCSRRVSFTTNLSLSLCLSLSLPLSLPLPSLVSNISYQFIIIIIYPLAARVVGAPQMISQPISAIFLCHLLPSGTWRTPGLFFPWCCLPNSSSVCLVFSPLSLCLARWFWPDLMNGRHVHTTAVCVSLQWSGGLRMVRLPAGSWHGLPRWQHGLCMRCVSCGSTSFPWLLWSSAVRVHGSLAYRKLDVTKERISRIFEMR